MLTTRRGRTSLLGLLGAVLAACGAAAPLSPQHDARVSRLPPVVEADRIEALRRFATRAFSAIQAGGELDLVFDDQVLHRLLRGREATRASSIRNAPGEHERARGFPVLAGARFAGACFQGLREEPEGTLMGLLQPAWVFERVLLVGQEPTGRIAMWLEGEFVWTDVGFGAIAIDRLEPPRRNHADLELAVCDVDLGVQQPLDIVSSPPNPH